MSTGAIFALIATAGALGDAGSPVSDTALGPTIGLNIDGQHNHFKDTIIPTMLHFNIPLLIFGLIATFVLQNIIRNMGKVSFILRERLVFFTLLYKTKSSA